MPGSGSGSGVGSGDGDGDERRFETARRHHEAILAHPESVPPGWVEQARFRDRYDLPPFRPPHFEDGVDVRGVIEELEARFGVRIRFVERDSTWAVELDGERELPVERRRDGATNVVVGSSAAAFRAAVERALQNRSPDSTDG